MAQLILPPLSIVAELRPNSVPSVVATYSNPLSPWDGAVTKYGIILDITPQYTSSYDSIPPLEYNGLDIEVGMWFGVSSTGYTYKITDIISATAYEVICVVEDVDLYNLLIDNTQTGNNSIDPVPGLIFRISNDGIPIVVPTALIRSAIGDATQWLNDLHDRFRFRNYITDFFAINPDDASYTGFAEGDFVKINSSAVFIKVTTNNQSDILSIAGIVTSVNTPSDGNLRVRPVGRIVYGLPTLPGSVGDVLYFDPTQPNNLSAIAPTTGVALPVYIKIDNTTAILLPKAISSGSGGTGTSGTSGTSGANGTSGSNGLGLSPLSFTSSVQTNPLIGINTGSVFFGYQLNFAPWADGQYVTFADQTSTVVYGGRLLIQYAGGFGWAFNLYNVLTATGSSSTASSSNWLMSFAAAPAGTAGTAGSAGTSGTSNGTSGSSGTSGLTGAAGTSGTSTGTSGTSTGTSGTSGSSNGTSGRSGTAGTTGTSGADGTSGSNGANGTSGSNGAAGTSGAAGNFGGDTMLYTFGVYSGTSGEPTTGKFNFNGANAASVTTMYINDTDAQAADVSTWLTELGTSTNTIKGSIRFSINYNSNVFADYQVLGSVDNGTWHTVTLRYVSSSNSSTTATFTTGNPITVSFARAGDVGSLYYGTSGNNINIPTTGSPFTLSAKNGCIINSMVGSVGGLPTFTYPIASGTSQTRYFNASIIAQTLQFSIDNSAKTGATSLVLYVNDVEVDCMVIGTLPPTATVFLVIPANVTSPSTIRVEMVDGQCTYIPTDISVNGIASSYSGQYVLVAETLTSPPYGAGFLYISNNYGEQTSWNGVGLYENWGTVAISGNGQYMLAGSYYENGKIYRSSDYGANWTEITNLPYDTGEGTPIKGFFVGTAISNNGDYQYITSMLNSSLAPSNGSFGNVWKSTDYGVNWTRIATQNSLSAMSVAVSSTGQYVSYAMASNAFSSGFLKYSSDYGVTFNTSNIGGGTNANVINVSMSASGGSQVVALNGGSYGSVYAYAKSNNAGADFTVYGIGYRPWFRTNANDVSEYAITLNTNDFVWWLNSPGLYPYSPLANLTPARFRAIDSSSNGVYMYAGSTTGLFKSTDSGINWTQI